MAEKITRDFDFKGIKRITIPKLDSDFTASNGYGWDIIKKYLPNILATHKKNAEKIDYLYNFKLGVQDILDKVRKHEVDENNNNIEVENHATRQVEFKIGFICGEPRDYTHKSDSDSDDLLYLMRYFSDCDFFAKDADLKDWIYTTGIGVTKTTPRTDIITTEKKLFFGNITRYKTAKEGFNIDFEAPFKYNVVDPRCNFKVYSSGDDKEDLFCVSYVDIDISTDKDNQPQIIKQLLVETRYAWFKFNAESSFASFYWNKPNEVEIVSKELNYLPLIEFSVDKDRIGIVEKNKSAFNTINIFRSNVNDMVIDNANSILLFKNVDIDSNEIKEMIKAGAVIIRDGINGATVTQAGFENVTIEIPFDKMATYIDQVMQNAYDIAGVPLASGQVTSGGDTGQARLLGGGWNNAYIIIHKEIMKLLEYDYKQLKLILMLCKRVPKCPLNELYASQVDIHYRVNQNDNLQVKAQSMKYMYDMNMPLEFILKVGGLSNDIKTDSRQWQENIDKARAIQAEMQKASQTSTEEIKVEETNDNNSQE
jgi:hypothetical protein